MFQHFASRWALVGIGMSYLAFASMGCNGGDETPETPTAPPPPAAVAPQNLLRAATLTDDAPTVDVRINGEVIFTNLRYPGVSEYRSFGAGQYRIEFLRAGQRRTTLAETTINLGIGEHLTVAVLGLFGLEVQEIRDNLNGNPNRARIKLFNAVADFPDALDLWILNGRPLVQEIAYRQTSGYAELVPGFLQPRAGAIRHPQTDRHSFGCFPHGQLDTHGFCGGDTPPRRYRVVDGSRLVLSEASHLRETPKSSNVS